MSYQRCPTCGNPLSAIVFAYEKDMTALCEKHNIDHERISAQPHGDNEFNREKQAIIDRYVEKKALCCRARVSNFSNVVKLVK